MKKGKKLAYLHILARVSSMGVPKADLSKLGLHRVDDQTSQPHSSCIATLQIQLML